MEITKVSENSDGETYFDLEKDGTPEYEKYSPLFQNLYESKMIYYTVSMFVGGYTALVEVENVKITPKYFSATMKLIQIIESHRGVPLPEQWEVSFAWFILRECEGGYVPYSGSCYWVEPAFVRYVEKLLKEGKREEAYELTLNKPEKFDSEKYKNQ
jgi:hypothetical protein